MVLNFGDSVSQSFEIEIVDRGENGVEVQCVPQQMLKTDNFPTPLQCSLKQFVMPTQMFETPSKD